MGGPHGVEPIPEPDLVHGGSPSRLAEIEAARLVSGEQIVVDTLAARAPARLGMLFQELRDLPPFALHAALETFVSRDVVDLETKVVEIELALPSWTELTELGWSVEEALETVMSAGILKPDF